MRIHLALAFVSTVAACGGTTMMGDDDDTIPPPTRGFQIVSPENTINAGQETTFCYYFKTPNTETMTVKRWVSHMSAGSHHMILFFTPQLSQPEGTVSAENCSILSGGNASNIPSWVYSSQDTDSDLALPADDGNGTPIGMDVPPGQPALIQLHYNNTGDTALQASVTINAEAYDAGVTTTKTAAYFTYDGSISIPAHATGYKESQTCDFPAGKKAWLMSTHTHQHATHTEVRDGANVAFASDMWAHPGAQVWDASPFYTFASGKLTAECTWTNTGDAPIVDGESAQTNEMCMASGYIFPATSATVCYNGFVLSL